MDTATTRQLLVICKRMGWNTMANFRKRDILFLVKERWFCTKMGLKVMSRYISKKKEAKQRKETAALRVLNDVDFATLEPIPSTRLFRLQDGESAEYHFNIVSLVQYFLPTGSYVNPFTFIPFTEKQIEDISSAYAVLYHTLPESERVQYSVSRLEGKEERKMETFTGTGSPNLLDLKTPIKRFAREFREREDIISDMLTSLMNQHTRILRMLHETNYYMASDDESNLRARMLLQTEIRNLRDPIAELYNCSPSTAIEFVRNSQSEVSVLMGTLGSSSFHEAYINSIEFILQMSEEDPAEGEE
jgi:hypothetical protein